MFQSSSTCAAAHASSASSRPAASASASSAEPVSVVTTLSAPSRQSSSHRRAARDRRGRRRDRRRRLRHVHHALGQHEARAERLARPCEHRVPVLRLARDQARRARRRDRTADRSRDISRSRPRPAAGAGATPSMIELASRVSGMAAGSITSRCACPFGGDRLGQRARRRRQRPPRRRAHRPAVEQHRRSRSVALADRARPGRTAPAASAACRAAPPRSDRAAGCSKMSSKISRMVSAICATQQISAVRARVVLKLTNFKRLMAADHDASQHAMPASRCFDKTNSAACSIIDERLLCTATGGVCGLGPLTFAAGFGSSRPDRGGWT